MPRVPSGGCGLAEPPRVWQGAARAAQGPRGHPGHGPGLPVLWAKLPVAHLAVGTMERLVSL